MKIDGKNVTGGRFVANGCSIHTHTNRESLDFYATDPLAIDKLLTKYDIPQLVWECACGQGHLAKRLEESGRTVFASDLVNRGYGSPEVDFLSFSGESFWANINAKIGGGFQSLQIRPLKRLLSLLRGRCNCYQMEGLQFSFSRHRFWRERKDME